MDKEKIVRKCLDPPDFRSLYEAEFDMDRLRAEELANCDPNDLLLPPAGEEDEPDVERLETEYRRAMKEEASQQQFQMFEEDWKECEKLAQSHPFFERSPTLNKIAPQAVLKPMTGVLRAANTENGAKMVSKESTQELATVPIKKSVTVSEALNPYEAAQLLATHDHIFSSAGQLYFFDGSAYILVSRDEALRRLMDSCRAMVAASGKTQFVKQVYDTLLMEPRIYKNGEDHPNIVSFDDGLLNLDSWTFLPHDPSLFVTTRLRASWGKGLHAHCPVCEQFMSGITAGDQTLQQRLWEAIGYLLVPDQRGKSFIIFQGRSNSGKGVLGEFIRDCFIGDVVSALAVNDLSGNFVLSDLVGKKLCVDFDLPADPFSKNAISKLKKLTGKDLLSSDVKFQNRVRFVCTAKFLFASNHPILLPGKDQAFLNRLVLIPFAVSVAKKDWDHDLSDKLQAERDAIVVKALMAYRSLRQHNYIFSGDYPLNLVTEDGTSDLAAVTAFLRNSCEICKGSWTPTQTLYAGFSQQYEGICEVGRFSELLLHLCQAQCLPVRKIRGRIAAKGNPVYGFENLILKEKKEQKNEKI